MLNNKHRIRKNEDFQKLFQRGTSIANRQFVIYKLPKVDQEDLRVGISVSKKIGNAVTRNRVKRLIREVMRHYISLIHWKGDVLIIARTPLADMEFEEVKTSLTHCLSKANLLS